MKGLGAWADGRPRSVDNPARFARWQRGRRPGHCRSRQRADARSRFAPNARFPAGNRRGDAGSAEYRADPRSPRRHCGQEGRTWAAEAPSGRCRAGKVIPISQCPQTPAERQNPGWCGPIAPSHRWRHCRKTEKCRPGYSCRTAVAACRIKGSGFPPIETSRLIYGASALSVIFRFPSRNSGFPSNQPILYEYLRLNPPGGILNAGRSWKKLWRRLWGRTAR